MPNFKSIEEYYQYYTDKKKELDSIDSEKLGLKERVEYDRDTRKLNRQFSYFKNLFDTLNISDEQFRQVIRTTFSDETKNRLEVPEIIRGPIVTNLSKNLLSKKENELNALNLTEEEKYGIALNDSAIISSVTQKALKAGIVSQDEYDSIVFEGWKKFLFSPRAVKYRPLVMKAWDQVLDNAQKDAFVSALNSYIDPATLPLEEQLKHPYSEKISELKANVPPEIKNNPDKLKQYTEALDYANAHLTEVSDEVRNEYDNYEKSVQQNEGRYSRSVFSDQLPKFKDGKYNGLFAPIRIQYGEQIYIPAEKSKAFDDILNGGTKLSDTTKNAVKRMIKKMEQMKLLDYPHFASGEDGEKTYAHNKIKAKKQALQDAIEEKNPEKIITARQELEETWKDMEELYQIARESFQQNPYLFPGNVDGTRNTKLSWEFTHDVMTTAQVNSIFLTYLKIKNENISIDEYLDNPGKGTIQRTAEKIRPLSFEEQMKGKSLDECLEIMLHKQSGFCDRIVLANPIIAIARSGGSLTLLEKDENLRIENIITADYTQKETQNITQLEMDKFSFFAVSTKSEDYHLRITETMENMILVSDEERNMNKLISGVPYMDIYGRAIEPPFNRDNYISTHPEADYDGILRRAEIVSNKFQSIHDSNMLADVFEARMNLYCKVLSAHQNDRGTPGFERMENALLSLAVNCPDDLSNVRTDRINKSLGAYFEKAGDTLLQNAVTRVAEAELNVHNGSGEYDDAKKALSGVQSLYNSYKTMNAGNKTTDEERRSALVTVKEQIRLARAQINEYFKRKRNQHKMDDTGATANADQKSKNRIAAMQNAKVILDMMEAMVDSKDLEIARKIGKENADAPKNVEEVQDQRDREQEKNVNDMNRALSGDLRKIREWRDTISAVDFNLMKQGSPQFNEILPAMDRLIELSKTISPTSMGNISVSDFVKQMDEEKKVIDKLQAYLDHKQEDFNTDPARRDSEKRQKREQPRIRAVIDVLEEMKEEHDLMELKFIYSLQDKERSRLKDKLQNEENIRNAKDISLEEYMNSVYRSVDIIKNLDGKNWIKKENETLETYVKRVTSYNKKNLYENVSPKVWNDQNYIGKKTVNEAGRNFKGSKSNPEAYPGGVKLSNEDLLKAYKEEKGDYLDEQAIPRHKIDQAERFIHIQAEMNRDNLLSVRTRQKIYVDKVMEEAGNKPMDYDTYIKLQMGPSSLNGSIDEMKDSVARIMAAGMMKVFGRPPFNESTIQSAVDKTRIMCGINNMKEADLKNFLSNRESVYHSIYERSNLSFGTIEGMYDSYRKDMQELYKKLPAPGNDPNYKTIFDNVKLIAHLPDDSPVIRQDKLNEAVKKANFEIIISAEKILKGNEKDLKKGFCEPTLDVLSTLYNYIGYGSDLIDSYVSKIEDAIHPGKDALFEERDDIGGFSLDSYGKSRIQGEIREINNPLAAKVADKLKNPPENGNNNINAQPKADNAQPKAGGNNSEEIKVKIDLRL